jgi:hypothetical protein
MNLSGVRVQLRSDSGHFVSTFGKAISFTFQNGRKKFILFPKGLKAAEKKKYLQAYLREYFEPKTPPKGFLRLEGYPDFTLKLYGSRNKIVRGIGPALRVSAWLEGVKILSQMEIPRGITNEEKIYFITQTFSFIKPKKAPTRVWKDKVEEWTVNSKFGPARKERSISTMADPVVMNIKNFRSVFATLEPQLRKKIKQTWKDRTPGLSHIYLRLLMDANIKFHHEGVLLTENYSQGLSIGYWDSVTDTKDLDFLIDSYIMQIEKKLETYLNRQMGVDVYMKGFSLDNIIETDLTRVVPVGGEPWVMKKGLGSRDRGLGKRKIREKKKKKTKPKKKSKKIRRR